MSPQLSRRQFLKSSLLATGGLLLPATASKTSAAGEIRKFPLHKKIGEARTVCPYCSVGCGMVIATDEKGHIINCEGDSEHIINRGTLDPKSVAVPQLSNSPLRLKKVQYRAPGSDKWEEKSWDWAVEQIAKRIKDTRDKTFTRTVKVADKDVTVNRTETIAWLGGAANNSEDCYLASKFARSIGLVWLEHQARI